MLATPNHHHKASRTTMLKQKVRLIFGYLLFALLALMNSHNSLAEGKTLKISTGEYPPWTGEALPEQGYVNHIVREAFAAVGIQVEFIYMPWKRAFEEAKKGKVDATSYWFNNSERSASMLLSEPLIQNRTVFFQRMEDPPIEWKTLDDLADYRISATVGFSYTEAFLKAIAERQLNATLVPSDVQNIKMLMSGRVELIATDEMSGFYMAATLSVDPRKLRVLDPPMVTDKGYLMATKSKSESTDLINEFNRGLKIIRENGTYQQILNRIDNSSFYSPEV